MNTTITETQKSFYADNGYIIIEDFLNTDELDYWRACFYDSTTERKGRKLPGRTTKINEDDGINKETDYFSKVFDQLINLWQTNAEMKELIVSEEIGRMAAELAGIDGIRVWHDQALVKRPWANPTSWHLDTPFWSFFDRRALSIWIALDDVTLENGCLFFLPGTHKETSFENPGIGKNMDAIFDAYPEFRDRSSVAAVMKAGSCSFHCGLTVHGATANMTNGFRRAMTCAFMPEGSRFNGIQNILTDEQVARLKIGDVLNDDSINPLLYKKAAQLVG